MQNNFAILKNYFVQQNFHFKFLKKLSFNKNFSFTPILLVIRSKYLSEDSMKTKKKSRHFFSVIFQIIFRKLFFFESSETNFDLDASKIKAKTFLTPKLKNKKLCWAPDAFGLNPPSQLLIGYHWLPILNQEKIPEI